MQDKEAESMIADRSMLKKWRDLALTFDNHRMQALWHLRAVVDSPRLARDAAMAFLKGAPKGEAEAARELVRLDLKEEHIKHVMGLVKQYGKSVKLRGHSAFECDKEAYDAIEKALREPYDKS